MTVEEIAFSALPEPFFERDSVPFSFENQDLRSSLAVTGAIILPTSRPPAHFANPGCSKGNGSKTLAGGSGARELRP